MQKYAKSNGHLRAQAAVLAMQKPVRETVIVQSFNKGKKDEEEKERREVVVNMTTAYFIAKEKIPFSKFPGLINLQRRMVCRYRPRMPTINLALRWCLFSERCLKNEQLVG